MTHLTRCLAAILLIAALSFQGPAHAQDGAHSHPKLDAKNAEQDAALKERAEIDKAIGQEIIDLKKQDAATASGLAAEAALNASQSDSLKELTSAVEALNARVEALEGGGPVDPPDPEPSPDTWPAFLLNLDTGSLTAFEDGKLTAPEGRYTVQIGKDKSEILPAKPFESTVNGRKCGPENAPVYHICGNDNDINLNIGENFITIEAKGVNETKALVVTITEDAPPTGPPPGDGHALMQVGPWYPETFNTEEPYINLINASQPVWEGGGRTTGDLLAMGALDPKTMLPKFLPNGSTLSGGLYFPASSRDECILWDGEWVMEWEGDADISLKYLRADYQRRVSPTRLEFTRDCAGGKTIDHSGPQITRLASPLKSLKIYRKENESALKSGKIYNPVFLKAMADYNIIRTMDLQSANAAVIRSPDDIASMSSPYWSATDFEASKGEPQFKFAKTFQGMPIEAAFRLGTESGKSIWFQAPITLGAPRPYFDFEENDLWPFWAARFADSAGAEAVSVLESEEWDRYADAFVEALIKSGYPQNRPLYVSLANEVWNTAAEYFMTTTYAARMGKGLAPYLGIPNDGMREGYGVLMARFKLAVDAALKRAGREQNITYVMEGQAAWVARTGEALFAAKTYLDKIGVRWSDHAPGFGVSVSSYWGFGDNASFGSVDFNDLDALTDHFINGSADAQGTRANLVKLWKGHVSEGAKYGVRFVGAYEGGSHFGRPWKDDGNGQREYLMTNESYREFTWGEHGGRVNYEINEALADNFPGTILSNYVLAGPPDGQPWFEGFYGADNPYALSWKRIIEETRP